GGRACRGVSLAPTPSHLRAGERAPGRLERAVRQARHVRIKAPERHPTGFEPGLAGHRARSRGHLLLPLPRSESEPTRRSDSMTRRALPLMLVLIAFVLAVSACGGGSSSSSTTPATTGGGAAG